MNKIFTLVLKWIFNKFPNEIFSNIGFIREKYSRHQKKVLPTVEWNTFWQTLYFTELFSIFDFGNRILKHYSMECFLTNNIFSIINWFFLKILINFLSFVLIQEISRNLFHCWHEFQPKILETKQSFALLLENINFLSIYQKRNKFMDNIVI